MAQPTAWKETFVMITVWCLKRVLVIWQVIMPGTLMRDEVLLCIFSFQKLLCFHFIIIYIRGKFLWLFFFSSALCFLCLIALTFKIYQIFNAKCSLVKDWNSKRLRSWLCTKSSAHSLLPTPVIGIYCIWGGLYRVFTKKTFFRTLLVFVCTLDDVMAVAQLKRNRLVSK